MTFFTVINCIDGRIQLPVIQYLQQKYNVEFIDSITEVGPNLILADNIDSLFYPSYELFQQSAGLSFNLGDSTGLQHSFVDTDVINGRTYYYAIAAYDSGDPEHTFPSENTKYITVLPTGEIITDKNTAYVTPTSAVLGYEIEDVVIEHINGHGTGQITSEIVDPTKISGHEYLVEFFKSKYSSFVVLG